MSVLLLGGGGERALQWDDVKWTAVLTIGTLRYWWVLLGAAILTMTAGGSE